LHFGFGLNVLILKGMATPLTFGALIGSGGGIRHFAPTRGPGRYTQLKARIPRF